MSKLALLGTCLLALGLMTGPLTVRGAGATFSTCDTDPTVVLSNGATISMAATIGTDASMVSGVNYVVHVPRGTAITSIAYDAHGSLETVQLVPDQESRTYLIDTEAFTLSGSSVSVTARATVSNLGSQSVSGMSSQHLYMRFGGWDD